MKTEIMKSHTPPPPATGFEIGKIYQGANGIVLCTYQGGGPLAKPEPQYGGGILLQYSGPYGSKPGEMYHMGGIGNVSLWNGTIAISNGA